MQPIVVSPFEPVSESTLVLLFPGLESAFSRKVVLGPRVCVPPVAYDRARDQVRSTRLLDVLAAVRVERDRILGVAEVDLFVPQLNFVFGEADSRRGCAVFSLHRLASDDDQRTLERAAKEAIHELGHTYGLAHCEDPSCVMWFSNTLGETDRKSPRFCPAHQAALPR